jgi:predicted transcriptional regulator
MLDVYGRYELDDTGLKSYTRSAVRMKSLLCLIEGEKDAERIRAAINTDATTTLHSLKELINEELVVRTAEGYRLTNLGKIHAIKLDELVSTVATIGQQKNFFSNHDIRGIPLEHLRTIGMLYQDEPLVSDTTAPFSRQAYLIRELSEAREIRCISSIIAPGYPEAIVNATRAGAKVDLVLTESVLRIIQRDYGDLLRELIRSGNFTLYKPKADDLRLFLMVNESNLFLGMYRFDGDYDMENILIATGEKARGWGLDLFKYYYENSSIRQID